MKAPRFFNKAAIAIGFKEPPRRRGLGKKNPLRIANGERSLVPYVAKARVLPDGKIPLTRGYKEVSGVGGINSDWAISALTEDSDVWQNIFLLRQRSRDLFRTDVYFKKYKEELWANVFGAEGITCRMRIKETEDRVVYAPDEKGYLTGHWRRHQRIRDYVSGKQESRNGSGLRGRTAFLLSLENKANATIQVGDLDLYANKLIEDAWRDWQRREYCTVSGVFSYNEVRQIRLLSAARDGDYFLRHVRDPAINDYGYSLQLINSEWCDFQLNSKAENGNEIRMGIERDKWGKCVAYYFITRQPFDWQFSVPSGYSQGNTKTYTRVPADEIIHYARYEDGDSTRPAPWSAAVIPKSRHLDKYEEAEVVAARVAAMKLGWFKSTVVPEGGMGVGENPDPTKANTLEVEPGSYQGLPWGVEIQESNPTHPNGNFDLFRKGMLRAWCAGMPGANYNIIANDLEGVNYSSGRLGMLDERELWKLIQKFDIEVAERPIFEAWLEMALMTGAIPLPLARFDKFNKPVFRGRRWAWVDPMKEVQANAMQVANKFTSRTRVIEDSDVDADFEEVLFELAEEEMMMAELGMDPTPAIGKANPQQKPDSATTDGTDNTDNEDASKMLEFVKIPNGYIEATTNQQINIKEGDGIKGPEFLKILTWLEAVRATQSPPAQSSAITVNVPPITVPQPIVNISELKVPEQKAPIVNFNPIVKVPEQKAAVINVAAPIVNVAAPEVNITNDIEIPTTKKITVERDSDGKLKGIEVEKE